MESESEDLLVFSGQKDETLEKINIWKKVFYTLLSASEVFVEKIQEAIAILKVFCLSEPPFEIYTRCAAEQYISLLTEVCDTHRKVLGGLKTFTDPDGPFASLHKAGGDVFLEQVNMAERYVKQHQQLEVTAARSLDYYKTRVMKKDALYQEMTGTLKNVLFNQKHSRFSKKVGLARDRFRMMLQAEVMHRDVLHQQTKDMEARFLQHEKERLGHLFSAIKWMLTNMKELAPRKIDLKEDYEVLTSPDIDALAKAAWNSYLKPYKCFDYQANIQTLVNGSATFEFDKEMKNLLGLAMGRTNDKIENLPKCQSEEKSHQHTDISQSKPDQHGDFSDKMISEENITVSSNVRRPKVQSHLKSESSPRVRQRCNNVDVIRGLIGERVSGEKNDSNNKASLTKNEKGDEHRSVATHFDLSCDDSVSDAEQVRDVVNTNLLQEDAIQKNPHEKKIPDGASAPENSQNT